MTENLIHSPADLRPGDIMLGPIGGPVGVGVALGQIWLGEGFRVGRVSIRHAAIVTEAAVLEGEALVAAGFPPLLENVRMVEAMPSGAREVALDAGERWDERYAYVRLPEDYPGQAEDAAAVARLMVRERVPYSFLSYGALGLHRWGFRPARLERWINRRRPALYFYGRHPVLAARGEPTEIQLPCEAICSVVVDQAWTLAGKRVLEDVTPQAVTPGRLAVQLLGKAGATWAFPRGGGLPARSWVV